MKDKKCPRCELILPLDSFAWKSEAKGRRASECRPCHAVLRRKYYLANREKEIQNAKAIKPARIAAIKAEIKALRGSLHCIKCGEDHPACLHFHHKSASVKFKSISRMAGDGYGVARILEEAEKCEVLCSNCHMKHHFSEFFED